MAARAVGDFGAQLLGVLVAAAVVAFLAFVGLGALNGEDEPEPDAATSSAPGPDRTPAVSVVSDPDRLDSGGKPIGAIYLTQLFPADLPAPPPGAERSCGGRGAWASDLDAVVADVQSLRVTLTTGDVRSFQVTGVRVVREPADQPMPPSGTLITCSGSGGPPSPLPVLNVSLDGSSDNYEFLDPNDAPTEFYFDLKNDDTASFDVSALASNCDCSWYLELSTLEDGVKNTRVVDDNGQPFRVVDASRAIPVAWDPASQMWLNIETSAPPVESAAVPSTSNSVCVGSDKRARQVIGRRIRPDHLQQSFSVFPSLASPSGAGGFVSMCSWSFGTPLRDGTVPTAGLQHYIVSDPSQAVTEFEALKSMFGTGWRHRPTDPKGLIVDGDLSVGMLRQGGNIYAATSVPAGRTDPGSLLRASLRGR